jgi:hypothetical protein
VTKWGRTSHSEYERLPLHAHALLANVPLHDVWQVELPGGGADRTLLDLRELMDAERMQQSSPIVRGLFSLRRALGRLFGWDDAPGASRESELMRSVPAPLLERSLVAPGSSDGPFTVVYVHESESVSEIRNATVHAFSVVALERIAGGYRAFWAIYVAPVGALTPYYMALIDPFRRWLVYPAILKRLHTAWASRWGGEAPGPTQ